MSDLSPGFQQVSYISMKERENKAQPAAVQPISVTVTRRLHESVWWDNAASDEIRCWL